MGRTMMMSEGLLLLLSIMIYAAVGQYTTADIEPTTTAIEPTTETPTATIPPTTSSVTFWCGGTLCPEGQDCINVDGSFRCADPCERYSVLDDAWRSTDSGLNYNCDGWISWQGWYRMFLGGVSVQMSENCVDLNKCGTQYPLWLSTPHPRVADKVVEREVCVHYYYYWWYWYNYSDNCCNYKSNPIHVKACPGHYYVYKFVPSNYCYSAYCADVNSKVCATCREHEDCVNLNSTTWTCVSRVTPKLVCGRKYLEVGLLNSQLEANGLDASSTHLADRRCSTYQERNGTVWWRVELKESSCGNAVTTNGSHATFSNSLFVYPVNSTTLVQPANIPFSCSYPLETNVSLDVAIRPQLDLKGAVTDIGNEAQSSMSLFRDANYSEPYPAGPVTLPLGSTLHVGVSILEMEIKTLVVVLEDCYATHSPNADDLQKYFLIQSRCPTDRRQVTVDENSLSLQARFSALLFLYQGDYRDIYLHCSISLCDQRTSSCSPMCSGRRVRSVAETVPLKPVTIGPITWDQTPE